jgi:hypothetical protein
MKSGYVSRVCVDRFRHVHVCTTGSTTSNIAQMKNNPVVYHVTQAYQIIYVVDVVNFDIELCDYK